MRQLDDRKPLFRTGKLGGGIWRIKWHPYTPNRVLVGAMHMGCRILQFGGGCFDGPSSVSWTHSRDSSVADTTISFYNPSGGTMKVKSTKKFCEHESMVYGANWLVCPHPTQEGYFEAAARYVHSTPAGCHSNDCHQLLFLRPSRLLVGHNVLKVLREYGRTHCPYSRHFQ